MNRIDGHGLERVDFFRHLHRSDFGGEGRTGPSNHHDGGNQRSEFARHGNRHSAGDKIQCAEFPQFISALQRQDQADEKRDQGKNGQRTNAGLHGLRDGALQTKRLALERSTECEIGSPNAKPGQRSQIRKPIDNRSPNLRRQFHSALARLPPILGQDAQVATDCSSLS